MATYDVLNLSQRDNEPHALARADAQCGSTATAGGLFQQDWLPAGTFQPNHAEKLILDVIQDQASMSALELTDFLGVEDASDLHGYLGKPGSMNANFMALVEILDAVDRPMKRLASGTEYGSYKYVTGEDRLIEQGGLNAGQIRDLFLRLRDSLGEHDWAVCLIKPFSWGHYVNILGIEDHGLLIGDPYGVPRIINDRKDSLGKTYELDWVQCELPTMRPNNRISIFRPER